MSNEIIKCRKPECPVLVRMLLYRKTDNLAPIEARPSLEGNIHIDLDQGTYIILTGEELQKARAREMQLHLNHFSTCKWAKEFSKKGPAVTEGTPAEAKPSPAPPAKVYLGDAVFIDWQGRNVVLTVENGFNVTDTIILEPEVMARLVAAAAEHAAPRERSLPLDVLSGLSETEEELNRRDHDDIIG